MQLFSSFHKTITASLIVVAFLAAVSVAALWLTREVLSFKQEIRALEAGYLANSKERVREEVAQVVEQIKLLREHSEERLLKRLKKRVEQAVGIAEGIHAAQVATMDEAEVKALIREALRGASLADGQGDYFIYDRAGNNILLPFAPGLEGTRLADLQDSRGRYMVRQAIELIKNQGQGWLRWHWDRPGNPSVPREKIGYIQALPFFGWWVGSGEYLEDYEQELKQMALEWIGRVRYGGGKSIFVYDYQGLTLSSVNPALVGANQWDFQDVNGVAVIQELIRLARQEEQGGFLEYVGTIRANTGLPAAKIGYARGVDGWQWMVGTAIYVDTINQGLMKRRQLLFQTIQRDLLLIGVLLLLCLPAIIWLSRYLGRSMEAAIEECRDFMVQPVRAEQEQEFAALPYQEFHALARSARGMAAERRREAVAFGAMEEQLQRSRKMEALGVLAGGVAHDLNNVLAGMVGYPDLILNSLPADSPQRKFLLTIKETGQKAANIVDDLLSLARRGASQRLVIDLNNLVRQYLRSPEYSQLFADFQGIEVVVELDPELMKMKGSQVHLQKTIMHLICNGIQAQPYGGRITIATENCYIDGTDQPLVPPGAEEGEYLILRVADEGSAVAPEDIDHIFEPYYSKKKLGRSGTGLGMAVVWATVQDHDGFIRVSPREGGGTLFSLYFRATREDILQEVLQARQGDYRGRGQSVLVVDDIREQRELANAILTKLGYRSVEVGSGAEAIAYLQDHPVDLVMLDMILAEAEMDGLETYRGIIQVCPGQKAIIVSGYAETERVKEAICSGVGRFVKKPYSVAKIGVAIRDTLEES
ncbi:cache domain-containing protein [Desulfogranum mediterraneum]|uniref:cache domain-containing protein n=1 Tax=Desulfogranum mediterraneum TaxID=160661 RepID=UPI00040249C1|nr:cache domain-containing protein [Desulfogranum mediterraneum]